MGHVKQKTWEMSDTKNGKTQTHKMEDKKLENDKHNNWGIENGKMLNAKLGKC